MVLVPKVPQGTEGTNYNLIATNEQSLQVILQEEGGGGGSITPVNNVSVVQGGPTGPSGPEDGSYSGAQAWQLLAAAISSAVTGEMLLLSPEDYTGETPVTYSDKSLAFVGQTANPSDTLLPELHIEDTGPGVTASFKALTADLVPALVGSLQAVAENCVLTCAAGAGTSLNAFLCVLQDLGATTPLASLIAESCTTSGGVDCAGGILFTGCNLDSGTVTAGGSVVARDCRVNVDITAPGIEFANCLFQAPHVFTGSVTIDAASYLRGIAAGCTFPATTAIIGLPARSAAADGVAVADDGVAVTIVQLAYPASDPITGFVATGIAGATITPDNPADTPNGTLTLVDPDAGTTTIEWGPIPAGDSVYVPFSKPGTGAGVWALRVAVETGTGDCTVNNASLTGVAQL